MKTKLLLVAAFAATILSAQNQPVLGEEAVKVSDNVWAIMGFPNIAIIVGNRATLARISHRGLAKSRLFWHN
jgi:hypothetical protein